MIEGNVLDVAVDIRQGSDTYGQLVAVELTAGNKKQIFVPRGFVVLSDMATFAYKMDDYCSPECNRGIAFDDHQLNNKPQGVKSYQDLINCLRNRSSRA